MVKMLKTSSDNRKCTFPNCTNTLSIYNHQDYCHVHLDNLPLEGKQKLSARPAAPALIQEEKSQIGSPITILP
jgi:hypothetical protein